jgi:hypothetical protein
MPHPTDQAACTLIVCVTTAILSFGGSYFWVDKMRYWIFSFPLYPILIKIYHPQNIYGIGYDGFLVSFHENVGITIWTVIVLLTELIIYAIVKLIKKRVIYNKN